MDARTPTPPKISAVVFENAGGGGGGRGRGREGFGWSGYAGERGAQYRDLVMLCTACRMSPAILSNCATTSSMQKVMQKTTKLPHSSDAQAHTHAHRSVRRVAQTHHRNIFEKKSRAHTRYGHIGDSSCVACQWDAAAYISLVVMTSLYSTPQRRTTALQRCRAASTANHTKESSRGASVCAAMLKRGSGWGTHMAGGGR